MGTSVNTDSWASSSGDCDLGVCRPSTGLSCHFLTQSKHRSCLVIGLLFPLCVPSWFLTLDLSVTQTTSFLRDQCWSSVRPCLGSLTPSPTEYFFISQSRGCESGVCGITGSICSLCLLEIGKFKKKKKAAAC